MSDFDTAVEHAERQQLIADLKAARAELVTRGRTIETLLNEDTGAVCALGAVGFATIENFSSCPRFGAIQHSRRATSAAVALDKTLNQCARGLGVTAFNDRRSTTDQDVLDLFDKTLAELGGLA